MCTLSIIAGQSDSFTLVMNRDEESTRSAAAPPLRHELAGGASAVWPTDPDGGGTWIAAASHHDGAPGAGTGAGTGGGWGAVLCLMNVNPTPRPARPAGAVSRGTIIPQLLAMNWPSSGIDVWALLAKVRAMPLHRFAPFRLLGLGRQAFAAKGDKPARVESKLITLAWNGARASEEILDPRKVRCLVSSGLGDEVAAARLPLFTEMVSAAADDAQRAMQRDFHRHQWPGRGHQSVLMMREGARTVSVTTCVLDERGATMQYQPV